MTTAQGWTALINGNAGMENWSVSGAYEIQIWDKNPNPAYSTGSVVTVSTQNAKTHEGRIGLQFNSGPIKFRKLLVREL